MATVPRKYSHDGEALHDGEYSHTNRTTKEDEIDSRIRNAPASGDLEATRSAKKRRQFTDGTLKAAMRKGTEPSQSTHRNHVCSYCQGPFQNNPDNPDMLPYDTACGSEIHQICLLLHQFYCDICRQHESTIPTVDNSGSTPDGTADAQSSGQHRRTHSGVTQRLREEWREAAEAYTADAVVTAAAGTVELTPGSLSM